MKLNIGIEILLEVPELFGKLRDLFNRRAFADLLKLA
jgi:hypothetical protein